MPHPALVISAGPGLKKIWEWCDADRAPVDGVSCGMGTRAGSASGDRATALRGRCCLIAVQTALRPLLAHGIKPHLVCALDYSTLSTRFYDGLTAKDVDGVTLVVSPKVNPCVPRGWPGRIRFTASPALDAILGTGDYGHLSHGGTVAHQAYALARYMGADPVVMVGQDLAFTDGCYYSAGAAIHDTWGVELNEFNTLEMHELERVKRHGPALVQVDGYHGPLWTDGQMLAYLRDFEGMWARDEAAGLTTIVTDDGAVKKHTVRMKLEEVLNGRGKVLV